MVENNARRILEKAVVEQVYDIYLQAKTNGYEIYFRNAQARFLVKKLDEATGQALIAHFKFCAGLNVGERRRTQLGACWYELSVGGRRLRLSSVGDFEGRESLVIRILHEAAAKLDFWLEDEQRLSKLICRRGLYLFAGPVGSGKTSLMFELARRHFSGRQVMTIEDPVELVEEDFVQLQVNEVIGNNYDELIKLSLRHRPELLIVGEIRDSRTARAVLRASLTGHTVFSTIHARSIRGVWARLLELGLSEWEIKSSLQTVVYQRLIAGKGLVDIAEDNFEKWTTAQWNKKITRLASDGHLGAAEVETEKIESGKADEIDSAHGKFAE